MMGAAKSSRKYNQNVSGYRVRKTSDGPNYQEHRTEELPPLMPLNFYASRSQPAPFEPHFSEVTRSGERLEMRRFFYGEAGDGHHSNYRSGTRNKGGNRPACSQTASSERRQEVQDCRRYDPDDRIYTDHDDGTEGYPYANNYHQDLNNARQYSSASMHESEYRRYHREYARGRQFQGQSSQSVSSERQHEVRDCRKYDPDDRIYTDHDDGTEGYPYYYANDYHQNLNNARQYSSASIHESEYRRYHREYARGRQFQGQTSQSVRTRSSGPPQVYRGSTTGRNNNSNLPPGPTKEPLLWQTRNSSAGLVRNWTRFNTNDDTFICQTCGKIIGLQIYKCWNDHNSCKNCKNDSRPCGICGDDITHERNMTLERNLAKRKIPCLHHTHGCKFVIKVTEMESHIMECPFQELQCPLGCYWRGHVQELYAHFDGFHFHQGSVDVDSEVKFRDLSKNSQNVYLIKMGYANFLYHVKSSVEDRKIFMTVQLIGTKCSALKWTYEVHVYNKDDALRKCILTDVCTSFVEPVHILYKKGQGSVLNHKYASTFINNGFLTYKIYIKKKF